jgi:catechol 2,3-dioxygenase-like lactoylglutathione lyase family enzyme
MADDLRVALSSWRGLMRSWVGIGRPTASLFLLSFPQGICFAKVTSRSRHVSRQTRPHRLHPHHQRRAARAFYEHTLGLTFVSADDFATVFLVGPAQIMLRVTNPASSRPHPSPSSAGRSRTSTPPSPNSPPRASSSPATASSSRSDGVWNAPGGAKVAWFKDPDGNTLSLSYHPA